MKISHLTLLFGILACLVIVGVVIPLRLHEVEGAKPQSELDSKVVAPVARPVSQAVAPTPPRQTPNYLEGFNYSFETADGWYAGDEPDCVYFRPYGGAYHGQRSAQTVGQDGAAECKWWSRTRSLNELSLAAGHHYYFSGRIQANDFEGGSKAYFSLVFFGPNNYYKRVDTISVTVSTADGWLEVSTVVEVPSQANEARVECRSKGKGHVGFDYLFLGLDIALAFTKTVYPAPLVLGDSPAFLTYTLTYSNTGLEPARNVEIRECMYNTEPDVDFVTSTPPPDNPPLNDEWEIGTLATTSGSIVAVVRVHSDTQKSFLTNLARMESTNQVLEFEPVKLTLWSSIPVVISPSRGCAVCISLPPNYKSVTSPGTVSLSHDVHNCGSITTNITVIVSSPPGWNVTPATTLVSSLPPSHTKQVEVNLSVPLDVPAGTEKDVVWTATAACGDASDSITDSMQVIRNPYIFLPVVMKRHCPDPIGNPCNDLDPYEPNNTYCSTTASLNSNVSLQAPLCSPNDKSDYYYADVMTAGALKVWLTNLPAGTDYDLYLYYETAPTTIVVQSNNYGGADEYIEYAVTAAKLGRYYVRVYAYSGSSTQPYTLRASYPMQAGSQ